MNEKMKIVNCQMDYMDNTVTVHYNGFYNESLTLEYAKKCYPNIEGKIITITVPNEYMGYVNVGVVWLK